jgi:hypothetical protein
VGGAQSESATDQRNRAKPRQAISENRQTASLRMRCGGGVKSRFDLRESNLAAGAPRRGSYPYNADGQTR